MNQNRLADKTKIKAHYHELESLKRHLLEAYEDRFSGNRKLSEIELYRWDCIFEFYNKTLIKKLNDGYCSTLIGFTIPLKQMLAILYIVGAADTADYDLLNLIGKIHQKAINTNIVDMKPLLPKARKEVWE